MEQERKDVAKFICSRGVRHTMDSSKWHFECNRSGTYKSKSTGQRRIKTQGSCKTGQHCPAGIDVVKREGKYQILYHSVHYGHERLLCHMSLSTSDRQHIAAQLAQGISPEQILRDIRNSVSGDLDRSHLITLKDVRNIQCAYGLNMNSTDQSIAYKQDAMPIISSKTTDVGLETWLKQMNEFGSENPVLLFDNKPSENVVLNSASDFTLVVMNPLQKRMLQKFGGDRICIDSSHSHKVERLKRFELTTLMVVDDYEEAFPVAFMCSSALTPAVLQMFYSTVKSAVGVIQPKSFVTDDTALFYDTWVSVMGQVGRKFSYTQLIDRTSRSLSQSAEGLDEENRQASQRAFRHCHAHLRALKLNYVWRDPVNKITSKSSNVTYDHMQKTSCESTPSTLSSLTRNIDESSISSVTLSRCVDDLLAFMLDKQFTRLTKLQKGKLSTKMANLVCGHSMGLTLTQSVVPLGPNQWQICCGATQYCVQETCTSHVCTSACVLTCRQCHACLTNMSCTCDDYQILGHMCAHLHAVRLSAHGVSPSDSCGGTEPQQRSEKEKMVCEEANDEVGLYVNSLRLNSSSASNQISTLRSSVKQLTTEVVGLIDKSERFNELSETSLASLQAHLKAIRGLLLAQKKPCVKLAPTRKGKEGRPVRKPDEGEASKTQQLQKTVKSSSKVEPIQSISYSNMMLVEPSTNELLASLLVPSLTESISSAQLTMVADDHCSTWNDPDIVMSMLYLKQQFPLVIGLHPYSTAVCSDGSGLVVAVHPCDESERHWVTTTRGPDEEHVTVYDYSVVIDELNQPVMSAYLQSQIAQTYKTSLREIAVLYPELPPHSLHSTSSLPCIVIATDLCFGLAPTQRSYDWTAAEAHLRRCLERKKLEPFPALSCAQVKKALNCSAGVVQVYCYCRGTVDECMVECGRCLESFHVECVGYTGGDFTCPQCASSAVVRL